MENNQSEQRAEREAVKYYLELIESAVETDLGGNKTAAPEKRGDYQQ